MQLRDLNRELENLQKQGVAVHAITAESGGSAEVKSRLKARNTELRFPVHSDPNHELLLNVEDSSSFYTIEHFEASKYGGT